MHGIPVDRDWEAEEDARHLIRANEIKADPHRLQKAKTAAARKADEKFEEAKNMKKAAKGINGGGGSSKMTLPSDMAREGWTLE